MGSLEAVAIQFMLKHGEFTFLTDLSYFKLHIHVVCIAVDI